MLRAILMIRRSSTTTRFSTPHFTPQQIAASLKPDSKGLLHTSLVGMPIYDAKTGQPELPR